MKFTNKYIPLPAATHRYFAKQIETEIAENANNFDSLFAAFHGEIHVKGFITGIKKDDIAGLTHVLIAKNQQVPHEFRVTRLGATECHVFGDYPQKNYVQVHVFDSDFDFFRKQIGDKIEISARAFDTAEWSEYEPGKLLISYYNSFENKNLGVVFQELPTHCPSPCPHISQTDESTQITVIPFTSLFRKIGNYLYFLIANAHQPSVILNRSI